METIFVLNLCTEYKKLLLQYHCKLSSYQFELILMSMASQKSHNSITVSLANVEY